MNNLRRALTIAACSILALGVSARSASAVTIYSSETVTGVMSDFTDPPTTGTSVSFSQFNTAAVSAAISCPVGFTCSGATLYEIDLGLAATASGTLTLHNANGASSNLGCLATDGPCSGSLANLPNGVGIAGTLTFLGTDPNSNVVFNNTVNTFTVATNTRVGTTYSYNLAPGTHSYSGSNSVSVASADVYDIYTDGSWATDSSAYVGAGTASVSFALTGGYSTSTNPLGVTAPSNAGSITNGSVTATYYYSYTESVQLTPEPATMFLMGSALVGLGMLRKRVKR